MAPDNQGQDGSAQGLGGWVESGEEVEPDPAQSVRDRYLRALLSELDQVAVGSPEAPHSKPGAKSPTALLDIWVAPAVRRIDTSKKSEWRDFEGIDVSFDKAIVENAGGENARPIVLIGKPGVGKTSAARYVAGRIAASTVNGQTSDVPLFVPLRRLAQGLVSGDRLIVEALDWASQSTTQADRAKFADFIADTDKPLMLVLDGIDELNPEPGARALQLGEVITAVSRLRDANRVDRVLWTCRSYDYEDEGSRVDGADHYLLSGFREPEIRLAVEKWHNAYAAARKGSGYGEEQRLSQVERFLAALNSDRELMTLACTPLFLGLMQLVFAKSEVLPTTATETCELAIRVQFIDKAHERAGEALARGDSATNDPLFEERVYRMLETLATSALIRKSVQAPSSWDWAELKAAVETVLETNTPRGARYNSAWVGLYTEHISAGHGVIEFTNDRFDFAHNSFCDVLAAKALGSCGANERFDRAKSHAWAGAFRHWASYTTEDEDAHGLSFAQAIIRRADNADAVMLLTVASHFVAATERRRHGPDWLYADLLNDVKAAGQKTVLGAIEDKSLPLDQRLELGDALADFGDPRIAEPVSDWSTLSPTICRMAEATCIIGLDEALPSGEKYQECQPVPAFSAPVDRFGLLLHPVTNAQFAAFINDGGYRERRYWQSEHAKLWRFQDLDFIQKLKAECLEQAKKHLHTEIEAKRLDEKNIAAFVDRLIIRDKPCYWLDARFNSPTQPVVGVNWWEASAFCAWLQEKLEAELGAGRLQVRLPTEVEWERAVRLPPDATPGGEGVTHFDGLLRRSSGSPRTGSIGLFPWARWTDGPLDMIGNTWDWTSSPLAPYPLTNPRPNAGGDENAPRIVRGSSWLSLEPHSNHPCFRSFDPPYNAYDDVGFRPAFSGVAL